MSLNLIDLFIRICLKKIDIVFSDKNRKRYLFKMHNVDYDLQIFANSLDKARKSVYDNHIVIFL